MEPAFCWVEVGRPSPKLRGVRVKPEGMEYGDGCFRPALAESLGKERRANCLVSTVSAQISGQRGVRFRQMTTQENAFG